MLWESSRRNILSNPLGNKPNLSLKVWHLELHFHSQHKALKSCKFSVFVSREQKGSLSLLISCLSTACSAVGLIPRFMKVDGHC